MSKSIHKEWAPENLEASLNAKYEETLKFLNDSRLWYRTKRFSIRRWSQFLRGVSIFLAGIGGIAPLLDGTGISENIHENFAFSKWGYIAFGLAAAFILFDKYYGLSSGWVRCMLAEMEMDTLIEEFKDTWTMEIVKRAGKSLDSNNAMSLLGILMNYKNRSTSIERNETEAWASEFQANMAEIQKLVKVESTAQRLGSIKVRVFNASEFDNVVLKLNGVEALALQGSVGHIPGVAKGQHVVSVTGFKDGKEFHESEVADVKEGSMANVEMKLPAPFVDHHVHYPPTQYPPTKYPPIPPTTHAPAPQPDYQEEFPDELAGEPHLDHGTHEGHEEEGPMI